MSLSSAAVEEEEDEAAMAAMDNATKIKTMTRRIDLLKQQADKMNKEHEELQKVAKQKEEQLTSQKATIDKQQFTIQRMLNTNEGQRVMLDEIMYDGKVRSTPRTDVAEVNIHQDERANAGLSLCLSLCLSL